ncbi:chemotaxis protein CheY [Microbacterium sp. RU33B]|uniref:chemotaxis protein CheY n=1 Tax=Microbacterium sp. RU33B TaxID=1907390 RepID=UPI000964EFE0|nr:chemotaxis protein CheY [Microbacterium sp. RU33B]SIT69825.1 4'-phosphopantetheinyl transferase [Microbacterium sp. RU33B]
MRSAVRLAWAPVPPGTPRRETAWATLRSLLPDGVELTQVCPRCGGPHGPIAVAGAPSRVSVAYAGAFAIVAVADERIVSALGIDAELEVDPVRDAAGLTGVLGPGSSPSVRAWTRVEAVLKADGRGLRVDPASVRVAGDGVGWSAHIGEGGAFDGWDADGPDGVLVSVAVRAAEEGRAARATP